MFPIESFRQTLFRIREILRQHDIPYHLTGGVTGVVYAEPRFTQDIDIVLSNEAVRMNLDAFLTSLEQSDFIFDQSAIESAVKNRKMFQLFDSAESLKLDMYPREMIPGELSRSAMVELFENVWLPIVSRSDAAASKLAWVGKGSHKSRQDLRQIMKRVSREEELLVRKLADEMNLTSLLEEVLNERDEIDR